jgi:membrane protein DedA with SNARE-associated domain
MVLIRSIAQAISMLATQYVAIIRDYIRRSSPAAGSQGSIKPFSLPVEMSALAADIATNPRDVSFASQLRTLGGYADTFASGQNCGAPLLFPTDLSSFLDLIRQHGDVAYSIMFAYAASHSLLLALFAGYAAHSGALQLVTLIMVCWFGSFAGDVIRFWIGRRFGARLLGSFPTLDRAVQIAARLADRHYVLMILFHRYPHGIRGIAGFAYGMSRLPWSTFLALNFIAAGLWSCTVILAGYAFGQVSEKLMSDASSGIGVVMLIVFLGLSWILSKKLERVVERG